MQSDELVEGVDYYFNEDGLMVFTEKYHLEKGFCCGMGCLHCPYNYQNVPIQRQAHDDKKQESFE